MKTIIRHSILSGFLVGLGVMINTVADNRYVGAMLFSLALLVIIECGLQLYTGKIGFVKTVPAENLAVMLVGNLFGSAIPMLMIATQRPEVLKIMQEAANKKFSNTFLALFLYGCLCGALMFIAVYCKKMLITVFCIMVFILSGYEHCIADFPYLLLNFSVVNVLKYMVIIVGNSVGSIVIHFLMKKEE
ncbi:MAG: formate/nitrite transporter family protein [Dorea sp.]|nr:formate/nitrite transporter family protein [Dorea sp.]